MRLHYHLLLLLLLASSSAFAQTVRDVGHNREGDDSFKEERRRWIEQLRRAEPGVDVDILDDELRRAVRMRRVDDAKSAGVLAQENGVRLSNDIVGYWSERGSRNQAGRTLAADIDFASDRVYVAAEGGQIWRATLDGTEWTSLNDRVRFGGVRMLRIHRSGDRLRIIVVHGSRVSYSDDEGAVWQEATGLENIQRWGGFQRAVMSDGGTIYAIGDEWDYDGVWGAVGALYRSTDLGETFERVARFSTTSKDVTSPPGVDWSYVLYDEMLARVGAEGEMETIAAPLELEGGLGGIESMNLRSTVEDVLYLQVQRNGVSEIHLSSDGGTSWTLIGTNQIRLFDRNSFAVSAKNPEFLAVGGVVVVYSRDIGYTWDTVNGWDEYYGNPASLLHADIPFMGFYTAPTGEEIMLVSTDGGLYRSDNELRSVRNLSLSGLGVSQYYSVYTSRFDTTILFAGSQDQGFQISGRDDGGLLDFRQTVSGDYGHISSGDGGRSVWTNYPGYAMYYPDALEPELGWGVLRNFPTNGHLWLPPIIADPDTPTVAYVAGGRTKPPEGEPQQDTGARLVRMAFDRVAWEVTTEVLPHDFSEEEQGVRLTALAISPVRTADRYVFTDRGTLHVSTDAGATWRVQAREVDLGGHYFYGATILPSKSQRGRLYIAGSGYSNPGVWVSDDNGATFEAMSEGLPPTMVFDIDAATDDRMLFAATAVGPYIYLADSGRWYEAGNGGAPDQTWWSVDYIEQNDLVRFGSYGRGIWDLRLVADTVSGVEDRAATAATLALTARRIGAGYDITLALPTSESVTLHVYDLSGRLVARLHDGALAAGSHRFMWGATTDEGMAVPSGEYFVVAAGGGTVGYATVPVAR